ncbi:MAG: preprotein translocase subunit YajC [Alphaproteobacteria bacterium]|nr:preprotein translocase subunit YajC [Alphaproteobacteria bacterium]
MFISPAYAQAAGSGGGSDILIQILPLVLIFVVFWFFLIRPQQQKAKAHREMVQAVRRGDQVIIAGLLGKITKVSPDDPYLQVEIADGVRVRVVRETITQVIARGEPARVEAGEKSEKPAEAPGTTEGSKPAAKKPLFSFGPKK